MSGNHSRFAPSSAHRVVTCPASLLLNEAEPDSPSFEAVEGTVAHYIHEQMLAFNVDPMNFIGMHPRQFMPEHELTKAEWKLLPYSRGLKPEKDFLITQDMIAHVEESVLRCWEIPGDRYVEQRVDITPWCPPLDEHGNPTETQRGTADFFACAPGVLDITDLKFGIGVQVFAKRNYQAIKYALGVINEYDWLYDFERIIIRINQPRLNHFDVWETTKQELLEIGEYIKSRYEIALQPNAPFGASDKGCQFCKVKHKCAHLAQEVRDMFDFEDDATLEDVRTEAAFLTLERQVELYKMRALFKLWIGAVEADIIKKLASDQDSVPGLKLVAGRSSRYWRDEEATREELLFNDVSEDQLFKPREMISPAQAEKLLPKKARSIVSELAEKKPGKPTIVDADDPRPRWEGSNAALSLSSFDDES